MTGQREYAAQVPQYLARTEADAIESWRGSVAVVGLVEVSEPVAVLDPQVTDEQMPLWGGRRPWRVVGMVRRPEPPRPTETAVIEAAKALHLRLHGPGKPWDDLPAHVRNYLANTALDVIVAASPHLEVPDRG